MSDEPEYSGHCDVCGNCGNMLADEDMDWCDTCLRSVWTGGESQVERLAGRAWQLIERGRRW